MRNIVAHGSIWRDPLLYAAVAATVALGVPAVALLYVLAEITVWP